MDIAATGSTAVHTQSYAQTQQAAAAAASQPPPPEASADATGQNAYGGSYDVSA